MFHFGAYPYIYALDKVVVVPDSESGDQRE